MRLAAVADAAERAAAVSEEEERRRDGAVPLWQAAAQLGAFTDDPAVLDSINALREAERHAEAQTAKLGALTAPLRKASPQAIAVVEKTVSMFAVPLVASVGLLGPAEAAAKAAENGEDPARAAEQAEHMREEAEVEATSCKRRFSVLVREIARILAPIRSALPRARQRAEHLREEADAARADFEMHIRNLTEAFERLRDLGGAPEESLRALLEQLEKALAFEDEESDAEGSDAGSDGASVGSSRRSAGIAPAGSAAAGADGDTDDADDGDREGERILGDDGMEAVDEAARRACEREDDAVRRRLAEEEEEARRRAAATASTDEERQRLLDQHDADQAALREALEQERRRQRAELEASMAARQSER
ncbi:unnamed protein product, partial [Symbiodinium microadriaticum]